MISRVEPENYNLWAPPRLLCPEPLFKLHTDCRHLRSSNLAGAIEKFKRHTIFWIASATKHGGKFHWDELHLSASWHSSYTAHAQPPNPIIILKASGSTRPRLPLHSAYQAFLSAVRLYRDTVILYILIIIINNQSPQGTTQSEAPKCAVSAGSVAGRPPPTCYAPAPPVSLASSRGPIDEESAGAMIRMPSVLAMILGVVFMLLDLEIGGR